MENMLIERLTGLALAVLSLTALGVQAGVVVNEVQSGNDLTILDEFGEDADWVELYNDGDADADLSGWGLSDKATKPYKWTFPQGTTIEPGGYLLVFCSGVAKEGTQLHSSLSLSASGETLTLTDTAGTTVDSFTFGALPADTSFGRVVQGETVTNKWFATPTPGKANGTTPYEEPVGPVVFSKERGVFTGSTAFDVTLSHPDPEATIWYTTDHSDPSPTNTAAKAYAGEAIPVSSTTIIRATAVREGHLPYRNIVSHSYLYLDRIVSQQKPDIAPETWTDLKKGYDETKDPSTQQGSCTASYTVSTKTVLTDDATKAAFLEALGKAPVVSVTLSDRDLFDPNTGIYCKPVTLDGTKRAASVEWVTGNHVFCTDAGLCAHGGASRHFDYSPKKSFGLKFRGRFGASKLEVPIFDDIGNTQDEFKSLVLRGESNHSWTHIDDPGKGTSMHDQFLRDLYGAMTGVQSHGNQVHLFINGLYWGLYNVCESLDDHFAAINWGGENEEYDVVVGDRHDDTGMEIRDGSSSNYVALVTELKALSTTDVSNMYELACAKIDLDMLIDYMLLEWYVCNTDWPQKNWTAMMSVSRGVPLRYVAWDLDQSMINTTDNRVKFDPMNEKPTEYGSTSNCVQYLQRALEKSPEYKLRFADHVHRHFYNDGVMTVVALTNRYATMADRIRPMVFAEAARWGAYRKDYENKSLYGMSTWSNEYKRLTGTYFPQRWNTFKTQLSEPGLYPSVAAPEFTASADRKTATLSVPDGATVYYTTDGSDPRAAYTGDAVGKAYEEGATVEALGTKPVKARALKGEEWSALSEVTLVPSRNAFLPGDTGKNWDDAANWSYGTFPNAPGADAAIGVPTKVAKKGWRNIHIETNDITVGWLEIENGGRTNRIDTGSFGNLTFCGADDGAGGFGDATLLVKDTANAGLAIIDLDAPNAIRLGSDTTVIVSNTVGDATYGGLLLKGAFVGNGHCLKKSGPGRMTIAFTNAADAASTFKLQCEEGVVSVESPIFVSEVTKSGELWVKADAADLAGVTNAMVTCAGKCNPNIRLFVPATSVGQTLFGGVVAASFKGSVSVYVPSAVGGVAFGGETWAPCAEATVAKVATADGRTTYQVTVEDLEPPGVLRLSEICPKPLMACKTDATKTTDATDPNGVVAGWIELVNAGEYPVNLGAYELQVLKRGKKAKAGAFPNLPAKVIQPGERVVVYTTKGYADGGDLMFAEPFMEEDATRAFTAGEKAGIVADEIVLATKVNPKKFQMVRLLKGADVIDTVILPADLPDDASVVVQDPGADGNGATLRYLTTHPTCGTANDLTGAVKLGPEVGPLYGVKHSVSDLDPVPPATAGQDYPITLDVNPVDAANAKDAIQSVTLVYRTDVNAEASAYQTIAMTNSVTDGEHGARWTASVPSGNLPQPGMLLQWKAEIVDKAGNVWTSPAFNGKDAGYEWYGTIVDPGVGDGAGQNSPTLPTWHMFAITGAGNKKSTTTYYMSDRPGKDSTTGTYGDKCMMNLDYDEVFSDPQTTNSLKVWKEFYPYGARVAIYDAETSNYYDNVRIDCRGNSSDDYYKRSHGLKFSKVKAYRLATPYVHPVSGIEVEEISKTSLCAEYNDPAYFRQRLSFWFMNQVGVYAPWEHPKRVNLNGAFYQFAYESPRFNDELLCDIYGLDPRGCGYKNVGAFNRWYKDHYGYTMGTTADAGTKKKTPDDGNEKDFSVLTNLFDEIKAAGNVTASRDGSDKTGLDNETLTATVVERFDLSAWINYLAAARITQEGDDVWGNLSAYYDRFTRLDGTEGGTGTWRPIAWDLNCSWGQFYQTHISESKNNGLHANKDWNKCHPFYGGKRIIAWGSSAYAENYYGPSTERAGANGNYAFEAVWQSSKFRRLYLRRLRTLMDDYLKEPGTSEENSPIAVEMRKYRDEIQSECVTDRSLWGHLQTGNGNKQCDYVCCWSATLMSAGGNQPDDPERAYAEIWKDYIVPRRVHLFETHSENDPDKKGIGYAVERCAGIPAKQSEILSLRDRISTRYDANLGAVVIENRNAETIDVSGWKLTGPVEMTLPPGTVLDEGTDATPGEVYVTADRRTTVAAMTLTNQVVVGNGTAGDAAAFPRLSDASGSPVYPLSVSVTVTLNKGQGTFTGAGEYDFGSDVTLTATPDIGYHFTKWKDGETEYTANPLVLTNVTGSVALTVNMPANKYAVAYDPNGGEGEMESGKGEYDAKYETAVCTFTKTGYTCTGWGTNGVDGLVLVCKPGKKALNLTAEDDGEVTLYAMWEPIGYTLSYAPGGAEGEAVTTQLVYDVGHTVLACPFEWEDHEFVGWLEGETLRQPGEVVSNLTAEAGATVVFTAQWVEISPVPEDADEPYVQVTNLTLNVGETLTLTNRWLLNPRFWLLGATQKDRVVEARLSAPFQPSVGVVGYAVRSVDETYEIVLTIRGVKSGEESVFLARQYKRKAPRTTVRYNITVK